MIKYLKGVLQFVIGLAIGWNLYVMYTYEWLEFGFVHDVWVTLNWLGWVSTFMLLGIITVECIRKGRA